MIQPSVRLEMREIGKRFGGVVALEGVSLAVRSGEIHAIVGENGAGKSTLMKIVSGAITDFTGQLLLHNEPVRFAGPRDAEARGISIIYQELNLAPELSAAANIFLGRELFVAGLLLDEGRMERESARYFEQLGARIDPKAKVRDLRIGDQQLVEIAKALSLDADIVIMDEPTSALADAEVARLFTVIDSLKRGGVTVLYISHKMNEVFELADRITVLRDGKHVRTVDRDGADSTEIINLMVGREISSLHLEHDRKFGEQLLQVENLSLTDPRHADSLQLESVRLDLYAGEIVGIAGLLGAGRTQLLECLFGAATGRRTGSIRVGGKHGKIESPRDAIRLGIAMVTEDRKGLGIFETLHVGSNMTMCHLDKLVQWWFVSRRREAEAARQSVRQLNIRTSSIDAPILSLSGGNQQKAIIARWLLTKPAILLLDEPTRGIDVGAKAEIYVLLRELCREGVGILMTSSELPELLTVCDRIVVLCEGRKTAEFAGPEATEELIMHAAMDFSP